MQRVPRFALLLLAFFAPAPAQGPHFGLKAGVPLTAYFDTGQTADSFFTAATRRYTFGPSVEWQFGRGLGVEFDVLFKRTGYVAVTPGSDLDSKGDSWDFPLLLKRRFGRGLRPYIAGGPVWRYIGPIRARGEIVSQGVATHVETSNLPELRTRLYWGVTAAGGLELGSGRLRLLPELRYVRWATNIQVAGDALRFKPSQVELLLGVLF